MKIVLQKNLTKAVQAIQKRQQKVHCIIVSNHCFAVHLSSSARRLFAKPQQQTTTEYVQIQTLLLWPQVVNDLVFSGSSDQCICAHNIHVSLCVTQLYIHVG